MNFKNCKDRENDKVSNEKRFFFLSASLYAEHTMFYIIKLVKVSSLVYSRAHWFSSLLIWNETKWKRSDQFYVVCMYLWVYIFWKTIVLTTHMRFIVHAVCILTEYNEFASVLCICWCVFFSIFNFSLEFFVRIISRFIHIFLIIRSTLRCYFKWKCEENPTFCCYFVV